MRETRRAYACPFGGCGGKVIFDIFSVLLVEALLEEWIAQTVLDTDVVCYEERVVTGSISLGQTNDGLQKLTHGPYQCTSNPWHMCPLSQTKPYTQPP